MFSQVFTTKNVFRNPFQISYVLTLQVELKFASFDHFTNVCRMNKSGVNWTLIIIQKNTNLQNCLQILTHFAVYEESVTV